MNRARIPILLAVAAVLLACVALVCPAAPVAAGPAAQVTLTPRPQMTPTPGQAGTLGIQSAPQPPRLHGAVLDWGRGNMPAGVVVTFRGDGWELTATTAESGEYVFQNIGNEVGVLNATIPAGRDDLFALVKDLPVRTQIDRELIVNVAFYPKGITPDPLVHLKMVSSSTEAEPGAKVSYTITAINNWDRGINQLIVADLLPQGLSYVNATASQGTVIHDRGMVWAELGSLAAGGEATVTVTAQVGSDVAPGTTITNQAAAYHSENAAVQNEAPVVVVEHSNGVLPVTGVAVTVPLALIFIAGLVWAAFRLRRSPG